MQLNVPGRLIARIVLAVAAVNLIFLLFELSMNVVRTLLG
jgi:hypothetical protein